jgi:hypothetical protein
MVSKPTLNAKATEKTSVKPIKVFRSGQVKASIWENEREFDGQKRMTYSVTVVRSYKEKDSDEWKDTNGYNADNLADLESVAQESRRFLKLKDQ